MITLKALEIKEEKNIRERYKNLKNLKEYIEEIYHFDDKRGFLNIYNSAVIFAKQGKLLEALGEYSRAIKQKKHSQLFAERAIIRMYLKDKIGAIKTLLKHFKDRHGVKFDENLLKRVENRF
jgi:tetratricopeptide (TPR) repeat protein